MTISEYPKQKKWIDDSSYEQLLRKWRFSPSDNPDSIFEGEVGVYYSKVMSEKRIAVGHDGAVAASKRIGWEKP